jgi:hypothetical protein
MSVTATFRREGATVVLVFADHLGQQYSETFRSSTMTDVQIQARADARAAQIAEQLAGSEARQVVQ